MVTAIRPLTQAKATAQRYLIPGPTEALVLPVQRLEKHPAGYKVCTELTGYQILQRYRVDQLTPDGSQGVQRALDTTRSAKRWEFILSLIKEDQFYWEAPDAELYTDPGFGTLDVQAGTLTLEPQAKSLGVADGQHGIDVLGRALAMLKGLPQGEDTDLRDQLDYILHSHPYGVKIALGWSESAIRRLFYLRNGTAKPVSTSQAAFLAADAGIGSTAELVASKAVTLLMGGDEEDDALAPLKGRISLSGTGRGMWSFKGLRDILLASFQAHDTPEGMALAFARFWVPLEQAFRDQKELDNTAFRQALTESKALIHGDEAVARLVRATGGKLEALKPEGATGTRAAVASIKAKIERALETDTAAA